VYQAGTLSGNPLATAAGLTVLGLLDDAAYEQLATTAAALAAGLAGVLAEAGHAVQVPVVGPLVGLFFSATPITDYAEAQRSCGNGTYARFFTALLSHGVALAPGPYEILFPSLAHTPDVIAETLEATQRAIKAL
jgi:glutamate-1-semialdehyde 2,1-aminomutase